MTTNASSIIEQFRSHPDYHKHVESATFALENSTIYAELGIDPEILAYNMWVAAMQGKLPTNRPETVFSYKKKNNDK